MSAIWATMTYFNDLTNNGSIIVICCCFAPVLSCTMDSAYLPATPVLVCWPGNGLASESMLAWDGQRDGQWYRQRDMV